MIDLDLGRREEICVVEYRVLGVASRLEWID